MGRSHILDLFTGTVFDAWSAARGDSVRWARAKTATRERWLEHVEAAAVFARSTQLSPLTREPLPNAPDRDRMFALRLSTLIDEARSRATTRGGMRRAQRVSGGALETLWLPAVKRGLAAAEAWISEAAPQDVRAAADALALPGLALPFSSADQPLDLSEAPY